MMNLTHTGLSPCLAQFSITILIQFIILYRSPTTPISPKQHRFGLFRVRSPLLAKSLLFSPPMGNEMFQFPTFAFLLRMLSLQLNGLPHSDIHGSMVICTSPQLFAAYHVLRRLREPRHPPFALAYFFFLDIINILAENVLIIFSSSLLLLYNFFPNSTYIYYTCRNEKTLIL